MSKHVRISLSMMPFVLGTLLAIGILKMDGWLFPVVRDFNVMTVRKEPNKVIFSGTMNKLRACEFIGVAATAGKDFSLGVTFYDDITRKTSTRPVGVQEWGPWQVDIAPEDNARTIELLAMHYCRPFGMVHTKLTTINLE